MIKKIFNVFKKLIPDILACLGAFFISYGAYMIYKPVGYITFGILLIAGDVIISKASG